MEPSGSSNIRPDSGTSPASQPDKAAADKPTPFMPRKIDIQWMPIQTRKRGFRPKSTHQDMMKIDPPESRPESKPQD